MKLVNNATMNIVTHLAHYAITFNKLRSLAAWSFQRLVDKFAHHENGFLSIEKDKTYHCLVGFQIETNQEHLPFRY